MKNKAILLSVTLLTSILGLAGCSNNVSSGNPPSHTNSTPKTNKTPKGGTKTPVYSTSISQPKQKSQVSSPHITVESIQATENSLTLYMTHGTMQTAYQNPKITNGVFTVTLINANLAHNFSLFKTYTTTTTNGKSYHFTKSGQNLIFTVTFSSNPPTTVQTGIGGGFGLNFVFK